MKRLNRTPKITSIMRILLGMIIGGVSGGATLGVANYLVGRFGPEGSGSFISVSEPEKLAGIVGAIVGALLGVFMGALILGMGLNLFKAMLMCLIFYFLVGILFIFWTGSDPIVGEPLVGWTFLGILVSGIVNGAIISFLNIGFVATE